MTASIYRQPNPLLRGSFPLLVLFLVAIFSAFMDIIPGILMVRPQLVIAILGLMVVFATGQFMKVLGTRIGQCVIAFTVWFILCVPFAAWPGGSAQVFLDQWYKSALIFLMAAGLLTTLPQAVRLFHAIAYSVCFLAILTLVKNTRSIDGRLILQNTRYANSNDLAWTMLVGLTFILFLYTRGTRVQKIIAVCMTPPILFAISRTGSRAGALGAIVLFIAIVVQTKRAIRIRVLVVTPVLLLVVLVLMPSDVRLRYTTFFGTYDIYNESSTEKQRMSTIDSTEARKQLLIDSLVMTAKHPLFGVGPGNFMVVQSDMAQARGDIAAWHLTHNTYTQLSSEMGLPGLGLFLAMLYFSFKTINAIIRSRSPGPTWETLRSLALTLRTAFIVCVPIAFFDALGYNSDVMILAGLTVAVGFLAQKQRAIDRAAAAEAVPAATPSAAGLEPVAVGNY